MLTRSLLDIANVSSRIREKTKLFVVLLPTAHKLGKISKFFFIVVILIGNRQVR